MRYLIILLTFVIIPCGYTAPVIESQSGTEVDGGTVVISGSGFGTNTAVGTSSLQFLKDNIEDSTNGEVFAASGWANYQDSEDAETAVPRYNQTEAHSGNQSIFIDYTKDGVNRYKGHFYYNHTTAMPIVYLTWWVKSVSDTCESCSHQWKIWRIKNGTTFTDSDILNFIQSSWARTVSPDREATLFVATATSEFFCDGCANEKTPSGTIYLSADDVPGPTGINDRWVRMEYYFDVGTLENNDGTLFYWIHDPDDPGTPSIDAPSILQFDGNLRFLETAEQWQYALFGGAAVDGMDIDVWWDDVFIQVGGMQRVEIGDDPVWANCTHREIQYPIAWATDEITVTVNRGSFAADATAYLFVVDANGDASAGKEIEFGSAGLPGAISIPGNLSISSGQLSVH